MEQQPLEFGQPEPLPPGAGLGGVPDRGLSGQHPAWTRHPPHPEPGDSPGATRCGPARAPHAAVTAPTGSREQGTGTGCWGRGAREWGAGRGCWGWGAWESPPVSAPHRHFDLGSRRQLRTSSGLSGSRWGGSSVIDWHFRGFRLFASRSSLSLPAELPSGHSQWCVGRERAQPRPAAAGLAQNPTAREQTPPPWHCYRPAPLTCPRGVGAPRRRQRGWASPPSLAPNSPPLSRARALLRPLHESSPPLPSTDPEQGGGGKLGASNPPAPSTPPSPARGSPQWQAEDPLSPLRGGRGGARRVLCSGSAFLGTSPASAGSALTRSPLSSPGFSLISKLIR